MGLHSSSSSQTSALTEQFYDDLNRLACLERDQLITFEHHKKKRDKKQRIKKFHDFTNRKK